MDGMVWFIILNAYKLSAPSPFSDVILIIFSFNRTAYVMTVRDGGRHRMVVGFLNTYAISAYDRI
jgi:hypothetical protein